ncbi:TadE family type IV pilus minor pilin [Dactylosporangium sp. NPDC051485]|uniref:TadE family type IV pilus minor pilin n=1 Tax=Dactylosporangium sp. NPDC051485 TaxID=3154846 RepID=UPI003433F169
MPRADPVPRVRGRRWSSRHRQGRDGGSAALEVALMVPVVLVFLVVCASAYTALFTKLDCVDAAGTAARAVARGEPVPDLGKDAEVAVVRDGDLVRVTVRMRVPAPMPSGFTVQQEAVAMAEPPVTVLP